MRNPFLPLLVLSLLTGSARAQLTPEWIARLPVGTSLSAGFADAVVDGAGVTYVTGTTGPSGNTDVLTAAFDPQGALLWTQVYNGSANKHDQGRGIALAPGGIVWVTGNTLPASSVGQVLLLAYDAATGALLDEVQYSSSSFYSEYGGFVTVDAAGNVYVAGGTGGDGSDVLLVEFDPSGAAQWVQTWDGPAFGPFSQDIVKGLELDPNGDPLVLINGVWFTNQADYVVLKLSPVDGAVTWQANWGSNGGDYPRAMVIDAAGDVFVTGTAINFTDMYSTIKLRGTDGQLLWQAYDSNGADDAAGAITLDGSGGVYVTGAVDTDGNQSNFNDDIYTVKRDAATGAFLWSHRYGAGCVGCFDVPSDVIVDPAGNVFVAGRTSSPPYSAIGETITLVLDAGTGVETTRGTLSTALGVGAGSGRLAFGANHALVNAGQLYDANNGKVELTVFQYAALFGAESYCTAGVSTSGCTAAIAASGVASASAASGFTLVASGVEGAKDGTFFFGASGRQSNPWGSGSSFQCVVPPVTRAGTLTGVGMLGACDGSFAQDLNALWCPTCPRPAKNPGAGARVQAQLWYRDPFNTSNQTTSLSDAIEFDVLP